MLTLSGESLFLSSETSSPAEEKSCSHGTDVAGIHWNLVTTFINGQNCPSSLLVFQNSKGSELRGWRGKMIYSSVIIILLASLFGPWAVMLAFDVAKASSCPSQIEDLFCCVDWAAICWLFWLLSSELKMMWFLVLFSASLETTLLKYRSSFLNLYSKLIC